MRDAAKNILKKKFIAFKIINKTYSEKNKLEYKWGKNLTREISKRTEKADIRKPEKIETLT